MAQPETETADLHAEVGTDGIGRIRLDRPKALNALSLAMVRAMTAALDDWANDAHVRAVLIHSSGERGLCAGGDIRALYDATAAPDAFFGEEYALNARIAACPKPVIALMDGIVMGGGIGISAHASLRIVTERSMLAMPETAIGFFPDVGATFLLSHSPGELGTYLALTGARFAAADAIHCGLADLFVPSRHLPDAIANPAILPDVAEAPPSSRLAEQRLWIDRCFGAGQVEDILDRLDAAPEPAASEAAATLRRMSPTSLKVTLRALRRSAGLDLAACLANEVRIAKAMVTPGSDFFEGVRAAIVDKDRAPRWRPAALAEVTDEMVDRHFSKEPSGAAHR